MSQIQDAINLAEKRILFWKTQRLATIVADVIDVISSMDAAIYTPRIIHGDVQEYPVNIEEFQLRVMHGNPSNVSTAAIDACKKHTPFVHRISFMGGNEQVVFANNVKILTVYQDFNRMSGDHKKVGKKQKVIVFGKSKQICLMHKSIAMMIDSKTYYHPDHIHSEIKIPNIDDKQVYIKKPNRIHKYMKGKSMFYAGEYDGMHMYVTTLSLAKKENYMAVKDMLKEFDVRREYNFVMEDSRLTKVTILKKGTKQRIGNVFDVASYDVIPLQKSKYEGMPVVHPRLTYRLVMYNMVISMYYGNKGFNEIPVKLLRKLATPQPVHKWAGIFVDPRADISSYGIHVWRNRIDVDGKDGGFVLSKLVYRDVDSE